MILYNRTKHNLLFIYAILTLSFCFNAKLKADSDEDIGIISYSDPGYPTPMVGRRDINLELSTQNEKGTVRKIVLYHSKSRAALDTSRVNDELPSRRWKDEVPVLIEGDAVNAKVILPWERPTDREIEANGPRERYDPGTTVFYKWQITRSRKVGMGEEVNVLNSEIRSFTMQRRIILAILGDSYGSGEGAPAAEGSSGWIQSIQGVSAHRSPVSGQELAVKEFFGARPELAYDYVNVSVSGSLLRDIYDKNLDEYVDFVQGDILNEWLTKRDYSDLDTIILSISGNDFGFANLVYGYMGIGHGHGVLPLFGDDDELTVAANMQNWLLQWAKCRLIQYVWESTVHAFIRNVVESVGAVRLWCIGEAFWELDPFYYDKCIDRIANYLIRFVDNYLAGFIRNCWAREQDMLDIVRENFTFKEPYGPNWEKDFTNGTGRLANWSEYVNWVQSRYPKMAKFLHNELENAHGSKAPVSVIPSQILVTGYPSFFKNATLYNEELNTHDLFNIIFPSFDSDDWTIGVDLSINRTFNPWGDLEFNVNIPIQFEVGIEDVFELIDGPLEEFQDTTNLGLFSRTEIREINNELAPPVTAPQPNPGGINHEIRKAVVAANAAALQANPDHPTDWCFIPLDPFVPRNGHLASSGRLFNRLMDVNNYGERGDPHRASNAFHPNRRGHNQIYRPAILGQLEAKLTNQYLEQAAARDGMFRFDLGAPDLRFFESILPKYGFDYDIYSRILKIGGSIINAGNIKTVGEININPKILIDPTNDIEELSLSPLKPTVPIRSLGLGEEVQFTGEYRVDPVPLREDVPFQIDSDSVKELKGYENSDKVLRYFFSSRKAKVKISISSNNDKNDLNDQNNEISVPLEIFPDINKDGLANLIKRVKEDLGGLLGRAIDVVDYELLVLEPQVREYFGFYSQELDVNKYSINQAISLTQRKKFNQIEQSISGGIVEGPEEFNLRNGKRPIYLFTSAESPFDADIGTSIIGPGGRMKSFVDAVKDAPRDGRSLNMQYPVQNELAVNLALKDRNVAFSGTRRIAHRGLIEPPAGSVISGGSVKFKIKDQNDRAFNLLQVGTLVDGQNILPSTSLTGSGMTSTNVNNIPRDGRKVFATLKILNKNGMSYERYEYSTERRNATLVNPSSNECLGEISRAISWSEPDQNAGPPVNSYRLAVGSIPGAGDIVPGKDSLPKGPGNTLSAYDYLQFDKNKSNIFDSRSLILPNEIDLPRDGRKIFITIGTRRGAEWSYESFVRECFIRNSAGLVLPRIEEQIPSSFTCQISLGTDLAKKHRLIIGTAPTRSDLFDSGLMNSDVAIGGFNVSMPLIKLQVDSNGLPIPVWATLYEFGLRNEVLNKEIYPLIPETGVSLYSPVIGTVLPTDRNILFKWNQGVDVSNYKLSVYLEEENGDGLYTYKQFTLNPSVLEKIINLGNTKSRFVAIELESIYGEGSPATVKKYRYRLDTPDLNFYANDKIPDSWQFSMFGPENPDGLAWADPDLDGTDNITEYLSRTNPVDPDGRFLPVPKYEVGKSIESFVIDRPVFSTSYQLQYSNDLRNWVNAGDSVVPSFGQDVLKFSELPQKADGKIFYRFILRDLNTVE